jgi:two-component system CAI-1 autoinducer sensor kinase/phosphatase CqsS
MSIVRNLFAHYRAHHDMDRPLLEWAGAFGMVALSWLYLLRFTGVMPPLYDDLHLRVVGMALCLPLALRRRWPKEYQRYFFAYSYVTCVYCVPFLLSFTMLKNNGGTPSVVNMVICAFLVILAADWRNAIIMLLSGYAISLAAFRLIHPDASIPSESVMTAAATVLVVVAGALATLGQKRAEAARLQQLYSSMAGSVAHEVRNHLTQLRYVMNAIQRGLPIATFGQFSAEQSALVDELIRETARGQKAISRGLQSISITLQQLKPKGFDVTAFKRLSAAECVNKAVEEFAYPDSSDRDKVHVIINNDFAFKGEETILVMVLFNLLKNAIYYFPMYAQASLTIIIDCKATGSIVVRDTGPGIPENTLRHLFGDFATAGKPDGMGLGLAFCRRAMRAFGGDISCKSVMGEFTQFTMTLPVVPASEILADEQEVMARARELLAGRKVLVVDDDALVRRNTGGKLAAMGCSFGEACDGAHALDMLNRSHYDLMLMDINMPVFDGYETARRIRRGAVPGRADIVIIGHSTWQPALASGRSLRAGMNGFLAKPCTPLQMAKVVVEVLEKSGPLEGAVSVPALAGKTVLLADDSAVNRAIVKSYLMVLGMQVIEAGHGAEVIKALKAGARPDAILMDMNMPGMDGAQTTRALRKMPAPVSKTVVIAITGHTSQEHREAAHDAGMNGFLAKPVDVPMLRGELNRLLGGAQGEVRAQAQQVMQVPSPESDDAVPALDVGRIGNIERLGAVNMLPQFLLELDRQVERLKECVEELDVPGLRASLHSLVGLSGEVGAQALYQATSRVYRGMCDGQWPASSDWMAQLMEVVAQTKTAVAEYRQAQPMPTQAGAS